MDDYRKLVEERIAAKDGQPIPNASLEHASILIEAMFSHAQKSVRIFTGELNAFAYGTPAVVARARQFLADANHSLEVAFTDSFDDNAALRHPLLAALGPGSNVNLFRIFPQVAEKIPCHFAIMDDDSYRFEADKNKPAAIAAFGDKTFTEQLSKLFSTLTDSASEKVSLDSIKKNALTFA